MNDKRLHIESGDLGFLENDLAQTVGKLFHFDRLALFFPAKPELLYLEEEKKLFIPLSYRDNILGCAILDNLECVDQGLTPEHVARAVNLCLELAILKFALARDSFTGLASEDCFMQAMEQIISPVIGSESGSLHKLCLSMFVIDWHDAQKAKKIHGAEFCSKMFGEIALALKKIIPREAVAAPLGRHEGRHEFGVLLPMAGVLASQKMVEQLLDALSQVRIQSKIDHQCHSPSLVAGFALYPQNISGSELRLPIYEQTVLLRNRARLAATMASGTEQQNIFYFGDLVKFGGLITNYGGGSRVEINLGTAMNAKKGMRFDVYDRFKKTLKARLKIIECRRYDALAEIISVAEPGIYPEPGDRLELLDNHLLNEESMNLGETEPELNLLTAHEFFTVVAHSNRKTFCVALCRFSSPDGNANCSFTPALLAEWLDSWHGEKALLTGIYDQYSYLFQFASHDRHFYEFLEDKARNSDLKMICGIFDYPFLDYGKSACEEALLKAVEYAALLPAPHIGVLDSLALNISADKLASIGDNFNAISEYRHAILADRNNANAWNSLGVVLAALGKDDEAIRNFITALRKTSDLPLKSKICYNLGVLFQNQKNLRASSSFFIRCLKLDPGHVFAWIRLGSIYEELENFTEAGNAYEKALEAADGNPETTNTAQRYMARLEEKLNRRENARILLHEALLRNPGDILAITALARSYLDEDPQMAELLARKSALAGDFDAWNILAQALEAQGKKEEAILARKIER